MVLYVYPFVHRDLIQNIRKVETLYDLTSIKYFSINRPVIWEVNPAALMASGKCRQNKA